MSELLPREYEAVLRSDRGYFAERCFYQLNPQAAFLTNWHIQVIAAKLTEVREGKIRRLIITLPPRHLKSLLASIAFPAWCLGHDPSAQILCVSYAQDLADKLARDCRGIMMSPWYRQIFPTRLAPHRHAVQEFITTRQGYRLATSTGGVLTGRGADIILIDDPLKPEEALSEARRNATNDWYANTLYSRLNDKRRGASSSSCSGCTRMISSATCSGRSRGRSCPFRRSPKPTRCTRSRPSGDRNTSPGGTARRCTPRASRSPPSSTSAARSASTISLVSISNPRHPWAVAWSRKHGSSATASTSGRSASSVSCRAGTPPTRRPSSATLASARPGVCGARISIYWACCASGSNIRRSNARGASSRTCLTPPRC